MPNANPLLEPSPFVRQFASRIVNAADGPVLDVACGSGRHGVFLANLGAKVVCIDSDLSRFRRLRQHQKFNANAGGQLEALETDLIAELWAFGPSTVGGVVVVDFLLLDLLPHFRVSLKHGCYLLIQTVSARGGNYLELPAAGELRTHLALGFEMEHYQERHAGPKDQNAVTVSLLARRVEPCFTSPS